MSWSLRTHKEMSFHTVEPAPLRASVMELHFVSYVPEDAKICKSRQKGQKTRLMWNVVVKTSLLFRQKYIFMLYSIVLHFPVKDAL